MPFDAMKLRELRKATGLSQKRMAEEIGLNYGTYRDLEQGLSEDPASSTVQAIASYFKINVESLFTNEALSPPPPPGRPQGPAVTPAVQPAGYSIPLLGTVGAGKGDDPELFPEGTEFFALNRLPAGSFALRVHGVSCQAAGIPDGATVVIEPDRMPEENKFVVCQTDDGFMLKLFLRNKLHEFRPGQPEPQAIRTSGIRVIGVVIRVVLPESEPTYKAKK